ncbi:MAG: hypothetical protein QM770_00985 [Tepidisphaeraceae bacterium]
MMLAQAQGSTGNYGALFTALLMVLALALVGIVLLALVRRKVRNLDATGGADFTLSDLRRLKESGQISNEEFERAKARMVAFSHAKMAEEAAKKTQRPGISELEDEVKP